MSDECTTCGAGFYLPSGTCDHCDTARVQPRTPHRCPVCSGTGSVSSPPGVAGDVCPLTHGSTGPYECRVCSGRGVLWETPAEQRDPELSVAGQLSAMRVLLDNVQPAPSAHSCPVEWVKEAIDRVLSLEQSARGTDDALERDAAAAVGALSQLLWRLDRLNPPTGTT